MTTDAVIYEKISDHIVEVTINRPEARNAVNADVAAGLDQAVRESEADDAVWAVILTGAGEKAFCAGADLKAIAAGDAKKLGTQDGGFAGLVTAQRSKLWIAAANGAALAGGCEIVLSCDLLVAADHAVFGVPEVKRGLAALAGGIFRLPRVLPKAVAVELIVTGGTLSAQRGYELGFVNRVVPASALKETARSFAAQICENAPLAVRESLAIARQAYDLTEDDLWAESAAAGKRIFKSEDFKEGPRAFIEKRAPVWQGR